MADKVYTIAFKTEGMNVASAEVNKLLNETNKFNKNLKDQQSYFAQVSGEVEKFKGKDLAGTQKNLNKEIANTNSGLGSMSSNFRAMALKAIAATAAIVGTYVSIQTLSTAVKDAAREEVEINKLTNALKGVGITTQEATDYYVKWADSLEKSTGKEAEAIISLISFGTQLGLTQSQLQKMIPTAIDLSVATGDSLEGAFQRLNNTLSGSAGSFGKAIPEIKSLTEEQLKAGVAIDMVSGKFQGTAAAALDTASGSWQGLQIAIGDFVKTIGQIVIQNPEVIKSVNELKAGITELTDVVFKNSGALVKFSILAIAGFNELADLVARSIGQEDEWTSETLLNITLQKNKIEELKKELKLIQDKKSEEGKRLDDAIAKEEKLLHIYERQNGLKYGSELRSEAPQAGPLALNIGAAAANMSVENNMSTGAPATREQGVFVDPRKPNKEEDPDAKTARIEAEKQKQAEILKAQTDTNNARIQNELQTYAILDENERLAFEGSQEFNAYKFETAMAVYGEENAIKFAMEEQRIAQMEQGRLKELAMEKLMSDKSVAQKKKEVEDKKKLQQQNLQDTDKMLGMMSGLMASSSTEMFEIGKAAAVAQAMLSSWESISTSFAFGSRIGGPILGGVFAAAAGVAQAVRIKQIMAMKPPKKNALGGVVDYGQAGNDTALARVNRNELILNPRQTAQTLYTIANGGGMGGGGIGGAVLVEIRDLIAMQDNNTYLDGQVITRRTNELNSRILK